MRPILAAINDAKNRCGRGNGRQAQPRAQGPQRSKAYPVEEI